MEIIKIDDNKMGYALINDISKFCGVEAKSTQELIKNNISLFEELSKTIEDNVNSSLKTNLNQKRLQTAFGLSIPEFKLVKGNKNIIWEDVKLYSPHIELLLMLMKNSGKVKEYKMRLVANLFSTHIELQMSKLENATLQQSLKLELQNKEIAKLKSNKLNEHGDFNTASKIIYKNELDMKPTELLDILSEDGVLRSIKRLRTIRIPVDPDVVILGNNREVLIDEKYVLKLLEKLELDKD